MPMWIYYNSGIEQLKPKELLTYLRTMWKLGRSGGQKSREDLVVKGQKPDTLTRHLGKAVSAGLLERIPVRTYDHGIVRSKPNIYVVCNPSHKVWLKNLDDITLPTSLRLLSQSNIPISEYYERILNESHVGLLIIKETTEQDLRAINYKIGCPIPDLHTCLYTYTQYDPRRNKTTI